MAIGRIRELFASQASITHYCLTRLMHNFDGKVKTVHYSIAEDLQALKPQDEVNIYDLIQIYASMIASVGDSSHKVLAIEDQECFNCGEMGHIKKNCPKAPSVGPEKGGKGGKGGKQTKEKCTFCGWKGHTESECRKKKNLEEKVLMAAQQPDNGTSQPEQQSPLAMDSKNVSQPSLAAYLAQLHKASAPAQCLVQPARNVTQPAPRPVRHTVGYKGDAHVGEASHPGPSCSVTQPAPRPVTHTVGYSGDAHIGEASHPGPSRTSSSFFSFQNKPPSVLQWLVISVAIALSIGDGMGCGLMSLRENQAEIDRYLAVEISESAQRVARNANPDLDKRT